jgi:hypothetical protein
MQFSSIFYLVITFKRTVFRETGDWGSPCQLVFFCVCIMLFPAQNYILNGNQHVDGVFNVKK